MKYLLLILSIFSNLSFAISVKKEIDSYATEGIVIADEMLISSSMKEGTFKFKYIGNSSQIESLGVTDHYIKDYSDITLNVKEIANEQLSGWTTYHRIMGVSFDNDSRRVFFLSPNYKNGSIISFSYDAFFKKSKSLDFIIHITDAGLVNDIKIDNKINAVIVSNFKSGDIYLFFKEELLLDRLRPIADTDKMGHEIDSANGLYLDGHDLYIVSTSEQTIYKMNIFSGFYDFFSKLDDGFPFSGGWPDDIVRIDDRHLAVSDNKNGGLYILNNDGEVKNKISLSFNEENLVPANMVVRDNKLYFSHLWKADLMNILLTELTPEDYDFNEYTSGTYSIDIKDVLP